MIWVVSITVLNIFILAKSLYKNYVDSVMSLLYQNGGQKSTIGFKYPTLRDHPLRSAGTWLAGKRCDDGAEGLWRIHDGLYDMNSFVNQHPGGEAWLRLTKGTDITEAFESHHIYNTAEKLLPQFFNRKALTPRNSPFTFEENAFYKTLKRDVAEVMKTLPKWPVQRSKIIADLLLLTYLSLAFISIYLSNLLLGALAGIALACLAIAAHNFFHQRDNFRMYYFDLSLLSSRSWRITHAISHHMYPNTIIDFEISAIEPYLQYLPQDKKLGRWTYIYLPFFWAIVAFANCIMEVSDYVSTGKGVPVMYLLPFSVPVCIILLTGQSFALGMMMFLWILAIGSLYFSFVGVNAAHHHPEIFHDGDTPRSREELDWGVYQLDAVMDRNEITGSHFLVITNFGDHGLHHLFPTIDHGLLQYLYPVLKKNCDKFGIQLRMKSQLDLMIGQCQQLIRRRPNPVPPPPLGMIS